MSRAEEYILVVGCLQGGLLFTLLCLDARSNTASRVLGLLCLLMASAFLLPFLELSKDPPLQILAGVLFCLPAAGGSLAYLYCRSALLGTAVNSRDALLFLPWLGCQLLTADLTFGEPELMVRWISGASAPSWRPQAAEYLMFAQAFAFAGLTIRMIWRYRAQAGATLADYNPAIFRWMLMLQVFTIGIWIGKALPALTSASLFYSQGASLLMVVLIYVIAITQWRNPQLFRISQLAAERDAARSGTPASGAARADGELDAGSRAGLFDLIRQAVEEQRLYLDNQLTLSDLAEATGLSRHHISETLNHHAGQNFYRFINGYRVAAVCDALASGSDDRLLNIALASGFSSKSTFNAIFKQFTGLTPTAYRRELATKTAHSPA